ncbi:hypothetical protein [Ahrensia sp. R2A130]|uniref:hypothetical protein n=1 Tax=Ahrensia sp. R2A130 TaxID=744979 RepID=UPI0001E0E8A0|nr:hypothetical protein [Ahrensia sp. R2A130]EFL89358.1 hypothetical protein R2A130_3109 [Ahrensia sp. R2A130]
MFLSKSRASLTAGITALVLGILATIPFGVTPASANTLSAAEVRSEMLGKTIKTRRFGFAITMRYASNGTVSAKSIAGTLNGTWRARGNRICTTFPSGPAKGTSCVSFEKLGPNRFRSSEGVRFRTVN